MSVFKLYFSLVHTLSRRSENFGIWRKKRCVWPEHDDQKGNLLWGGLTHVLIVDWHHLHHLDTYWKCRFMDLTLDLQNQILQSGAPQSEFYQILQMVLVQIQVWEKLLSHVFPAAAAKSLQSCPTLCDPMDCSLPGSSIHGILQARTLEWVAISFSNAWKWKVRVKSLSRVWLLATPWTAAYQAPPSMGFSRQQYCSGVPLPSPMFSLVSSFSTISCPVRKRQGEKKEGKDFLFVWILDSKESGNKQTLCKQRNHVCP